ncbi:Transient receptor potential-gamma protein [Nymphon striatum]|nr:Transient receptor potential-gamma protein [Nymphon striatum]KAG1682264.1 Transient receptor potential-gamma protein [Nymphon striatum]
MRRKRNFGNCDDNAANLEEIKVSQSKQNSETDLRGELTWQEKKYLLHVERGDIASITKLLHTYQKSENLNIDCIDPLGRSALVIAIENENYQLTELLLKFGVKPQNALLHAIKEQYVEASWEKISDDISTFTKDVTPLILAAQTDNYEILKILLDRGATLPAPHDVRCGCDECITARKKDCLRHSRSRINAYTALSSPSLISLSSKDPIMTAFDLTDELIRLANIENEFKKEYRQLAKKSQDFVTSLLDHTRTSEELEIILNYDLNEIPPPPNSGGRMKLQRLKEALHYRQKQFVAHPHVQQLLASVWYEGMPGFRRKGPIRQLIEVGQLGLLFPVCCILYLVLPSCSLAHRLENPFTKFICHSSSYLFFLLLLVLETQNVEDAVIEIIGSHSMVTKLHLSQRQQRGALPSSVETAIIIYIFGRIRLVRDKETMGEWNSELLQGHVECRGIHHKCPLRSLDGSQDCIAFSGSYNDVMDAARDVMDAVRDVIPVACEALLSKMLLLLWLRSIPCFNATATTREALVQSEISAGLDPHLPRENWDDFDPLLISEGIFGAANIFSFLKLVHIFSVNPHLGPLQVSLGRMVFDIMKFFFIYTLVVFSFGCGMNQLLWYYADMDYRACQALPLAERSPHEDGPCKVWRRFSNLFETSQTLFWASFGLIDLDNFELTGIKGYTRFWGLLMFGCYSVINIVVLLNLLIAMMSTSYNIISMRSDMEWKFARSRLWMSYFEDSNVLPPPFNIIPSLRDVLGLISFCCGKRKCRGTIQRKYIKERDIKYQVGNHITFLMLSHNRRVIG